MVRTTVSFLYTRKSNGNPDITYGLVSNEIAFSKRDGTLIIFKRLCANDGEFALALKYHEVA